MGLRLEKKEHFFSTFLLCSHSKYIVNHMTTSKKCAYEQERTCWFLHITCDRWLFFMTFYKIPKSYLLCCNLQCCQQSAQYKCILLLFSTIIVVCRMHRWIWNWSGIFAKTYFWSFSFHLFSGNKQQKSINKLVIEIDKLSFNWK